MNEEKYIPSASIIAEQCLQEQNPVKSFAVRLAIQMADSAQYARNADFYRNILVQISETLKPMFPDIVRADDGSIQEEPLIFKIHEYVVILVGTVKDLQGEIELLERTLGTSETYVE